MGAADREPPAETGRRQGWDKGLDPQACQMVCNISAAMVGVCLTGVSLLRVLSSMHAYNSWADDALCIDALGFLVATLTSYLAIRTRNLERSHRLERVADVVFMASMVLLTLSCFFITYAMFG